MATPWTSEEERKEFFEKLELKDAVEPSVLMLEKLAVEELDNMICEDIVAVFKKYFPNTKVDKQKVLKLARMLIAEEKTESQKATESDLEEKIRKFENDATNCATQIAVDTARRLYKKDHGYMPDYPQTAEELLWIGNYAKEMMHSIANEILGSDEPFEPITEVIL